MSVQPMVTSASKPVIPGQDRGRIRGWIHEANRYPIIPGIIMLFMMIAALFAPLVAPHDPLYGYLGDREIPPIWYPEGSITHIMGTDQQGRDMLSRVYIRRPDIRFYRCGRRRHRWDHRYRLGNHRRLVRPPRR